jgi:hypothetical protein
MFRFSDIKSTKQNVGLNLLFTLKVTFSRSCFRYTTRVRVLPHIQRPAANSISRQLSLGGLL